MQWPAAAGGGGGGLRERPNCGNSRAYRQAVCTGSASQAEGRHQFNSCKFHIVRAQCADNVTIHCAGASQTCMIVCVCPVEWVVFASSNLKNTSTFLRIRYQSFPMMKSCEFCSINTRQISNYRMKMVLSATENVWFWWLPIHDGRLISVMTDTPSHTSTLKHEITPTWNNTV